MSEAKTIFSDSSEEKGDNLINTLVPFRSFFVARLEFSMSCTNSGTSTAPSKVIQSATNDGDTEENAGTDGDEHDFENFNRIGRSALNFGEPMVDLERNYPNSVAAILGKAGVTSSPDIIAEVGWLVVVDCQPADANNFPSNENFMQAGEVAVLLQPWKRGDESILVRGQLGTDGPMHCSGPVMKYLTKRAALPEDHAIKLAYLHAWFGFWFSNVNYDMPFIVCWSSLGRIPPPQASEPDGASFSLPGPIQRFDQIRIPFDRIDKSLLSAEHYATISGYDAERRDLACMILQMKPNKAMTKCLVVLLTNSISVLAKRKSGDDDYNAFFLDNVEVLTGKEFENLARSYRCSLDEVLTSDTLCEYNALFDDFVSS